MQAKSSKQYLCGEIEQKEESRYLGSPPIVHPERFGWRMQAWLIGRSTTPVRSNIENHQDRCSGTGKRREPNANHPSGKVR